MDQITETQKVGRARGHLQICQHVPGHADGWICFTSLSNSPQWVNARA
ncbi:hypothetical protein [Cereibacter ovatus]|nr:hypothetical protein [Cereibacter ovatus]